MSFPDLVSFVDQLRREGDLVVVETPVDAFLEAAEIHRRVIAAGGPALLFTAIKGADFPLVTNLFGTANRAQRVLGSRPEKFIRRAVEFLQTGFPPSLSKLWGARDLLRTAMRVGMKETRKGAVLHSVSQQVRLNRLPILTSWPEDGGPFVTLPLVYTEHPHGKGHNLGMYRMQLHDQSTTGMHWQIGKGGGFHHVAAESVGQTLPVTVFLGGPPALILSAIAPLPENVPELFLASLLAGQRLKWCPGPARTRLIADADFALIGKVSPGIRRPEGPFGDHYGYYSLEHDFPVFEVEWLCHRRGALYPATVVGKPRQEDFYVGDLLQQLLSPLFPLVMPSVSDLWSYGETGYHSLAAAVVCQRYNREAVSTAFRILGEGQLSLTKFLLITDQKVDLRDFPATLQHVLARTNPETDLYVLDNLSMDTLDYTGPALNEGSKGILLGLGDPVRKLPVDFQSSEKLPGVTSIEVFCPGCLIVGTASRSDDPQAAERLAGQPVFRDWPLIVLSEDPQRAAKTTMSFLWTTFTRFEPAADVYAAQREVIRNHISYRLPIVVDARLKPGFPEEVRSDPQIGRKVSKRWREYFPSGVEMGGD